MRKTLSVLLLSFVAGTLAVAQQAPTTPTRTLTPAEQKQKDKIDREIQRERQIRAEWAQKQREYEAKQAEKERQKQAKKAGKEAPPQAAPVAKPAVVTPTAPTPTAPVTTPAVSQPVETTPAVVAPSRKELREKRRQEEKEAKEREDAKEKEARAAKAAQEKTEKEAREAREKAEKVEQVTPATPAAPVVLPAEKPVKFPGAKRGKIPTYQPADTTAEATSEPTSLRPRREFLPKGHLFDPILLDPLEAQTYGSILPGYWTEGQKYKGSIVPFAFGFAKPFYRRTTAPGRSEEWVLDLASFTQFEAYHDDVQNKARRQIINNDYKISIIYNIRRGENNYRIRVYHLSSHLGDDYIYRNKLTAPSPNSVNYELLDFTYSRNVNNWRLYGGAGAVLRKTEERKLLSAQLGAFYKKPSAKAARLVGGVDIKFWQQTDFRPGIHGGIGIELGRTQNNLTFLLEGYSGFRPYSQFEDQQTAWIGVGLYLNPF